MFGETCTSSRLHRYQSNDIVDIATLPSANQINLLDWTESRDIDGPDQYPGLGGISCQQIETILSEDFQKDNSFPVHHGQVRGPTIV